MEKLTVLVVDDEPGIRMGVERILRNFTVDYPFMDDTIGFDIQLASTGEEAIEFVDNNKTDVVLLDNKLPGMQGIEVLEYINKKQYEILVMMITSHASLDIAVKATNHGAYDFVPKPFTPQELKSSMENITKQIFLKKMTQRMNREGKQIRFQFLSVLSHELKAPINAIEGYLNMIKEKHYGDEMEDYQFMVDRSLERLSGMRNLIMDLLDLTQIESGKKKRELQTIDILPLAKSAIDTMKPLAIQKDVIVKLNAPEQVLMLADKDEIEIILNNLISNAIKYNRENGKVYCTLQRLDGKIIITVEDTGIGMSEEESSKLFEEFVRIKNAKTKNITGSGLGLSIVKKLTELYHGQINLKTATDKGSVFTVTLPSK